MATITTQETIESRVEGGTRKFLFRYTLSNGEVHTRRAWVPDGTDEATVRSFRGAMGLTELAEVEAAQLLAGN